MRPRTAVLASTAAVVAAAMGATFLMTAKSASSATRPPPPNTAAVVRGNLSDQISAYGTVTFRARVDGAPYVVVNRARGTYTALPAAGTDVACGAVLYRVDDRPVLLLCGPTPAYRSLSQGSTGPDVAQLNANLVHLGYATTARLNPSSDTFSPATVFALQRLQTKVGQPPTGSLDLGDAVFLPEPMRIATVSGTLGGSAQPGAPLLTATSDTPEVVVALDPSLQDAVKQGDRVQIVLPSNTPTTGRVLRLGSVAEVATGQGASQSGPQNGTAAATIPLYISLDQPDEARRFDQAPVQVQITTAGVRDVLSVPVTAIVASSGGGYAVEVASADGGRALVAVRLGLFDHADGRVQVEGDVHEGDAVVVPAS